MPKEKYICSKRDAAKSRRALAERQAAGHPEMRTIFVVDSLNNFKDKLVQSGAAILNEPKQLPTGVNMVVKHPDGAVIEYVELQS
ncbi:MAG: VOC family protein [Thermoleophilia bacterium]